MEIFFITVGKQHDDCFDASCIMKAKFEKLRDE